MNAIDSIILLEKDFAELRARTDVDTETKKAVGDQYQSRIAELDKQRETLLDEPDVAEILDVATAKNKLADLQKLRQEAETYLQRHVEPEMKKYLALAKKETDLMSEAYTIWRP